MRTKKLSSWLVLFKQALKGNNQHDLTQGSIGQAAFLLAVPMILEMFMESIFAVVDIFFVSGLGAEAVAVVGLTEAILTLLYALAIGLSMATTAIVARRIGEKNNTAANIFAAQALWLGLLVATAVAMAGLMFAEHILNMMGGSAEIVAIGKDYTTIMLSGSITILYLFLINAIFRGAGDATIAMRSLWLANGINIVLDPLLIYGVGPFPECGVTGAAIATTIGRGIGVCYQLYHLRGHVSRIKLGLKDLALKFSALSQLAHVSIGGVLQFLIATASWVALMRIVSQFGSAAIAGYTIGIRVILFTLLPAWGLSNAAATLVGQNLGAQQPERAEKSVWTVVKYNVVFMLAVALIFIVFAEEIIGLFSQDYEVILYGVTCLRYISYGCGFYAAGMVLVQAFNGAGDTQTPTKLNFFCYWLCQIPLAYMLAQEIPMGPPGVFLAVTLAQSLLAVVSLVLFKQGKWKTMHV